MFRTRPALVALASLLVVTSAASPATVRKVDPGLGPFFQVQDAVNASADGDIVLVKSGTYATTVIDAKSVSVLADSGALPFVTSLEIRNLTASKRVVIGGLFTNLSPNPFSPQYSVNIHDNAGKVILQSCSITGGAPAIRVATSSDVLVTDSDVLGSGHEIAVLDSLL